MPGWLLVVALLLSNVAVHAVARLLVPEAAKPWTTANLLTWVFWFVVVLPGVLVGWSNASDAVARKRLRASLDAFKASGAAPVRELALRVLEAQAHGLLAELLGILEGRDDKGPELSAFLAAGRKYLAAAGYGSGAFHGDGWAALTVTETWTAAKQAAAALP